MIIQWKPQLHRHPIYSTLPELVNSKNINDGSDLIAVRSRRKQDPSHMITKLHSELGVTLVTWPASVSNDWI